MSKAIVVLSGGQDSTVCLYWALSLYDEVQAITFDYGQRHWREIHAAVEIAIMAGVKHEIVKVPQLAGGSPLTDRSAALETYADFDSMDQIIGDRVELTFVPMRNALFLTLAANRAVVAGADAIVTGVCQQDNANYPDCRGEFIQAQQKAIHAALGVENLVIEAPLLDLSKAESVRLAQNLPGCMEAMAFSHTCYAGEYPPCGKCHSCVLRAHGFEEAGVPDPLVERAERERGTAHPLVERAERERGTALCQ